VAALGVLLASSPLAASLPITDRPWVEMLLETAGRHLVTPAVWSALARRGQADRLPPDLAEYLEAMHELNRRRNARLAVQAAETAAALSPAGMRPVFLKGLAHLLIGIYPDPAARFVGDMDLLLSPEQVEPAAAELARIGYRRLPTAAWQSHDDVRLLHPERPAMIELHRSSLELPLAAIMPTDAVIKRSATLPGVPNAAVPCPEDLVVHNTAHAMVQHRFFRLAELPLRDAWDLVLLAERFRLDWPAVERRLAIGPGGPHPFGFYVRAAAATMPGARLPASAQGTSALRRWRRRRGRPPGAWRQACIHLVDYAEDRAWRWCHLPGERRHLASELLSPHAYRRLARSIAGIAQDGPPPPSPGRCFTSGSMP
jgi:hypothetical protein